MYKLRTFYAVLFLLVSSLAYSGEAKGKYHAYLFIDYNCKPEVKKYSDDKHAKNYQRKLNKRWENVMGYYKASGKRGPEPVKPIFKKIGAFKLSEIENKGKEYKEAYEDVIDDVKKEFREIQKYVKYSEVYKKKMARRRRRRNRNKKKKKESKLPPGPKRLPERNIPEKYAMAIWNHSLVVDFVGPIKVKFWAKATPPEGKKSKDPLRMVVVLKAEFRRYSGGDVDKIKEEIKPLGKLLRLIGENQKTAIFQYTDPYVVEIEPDGEWHEYEVAVEWELLRELHFNFFKTGTLAMAVVDPGIYHVDDVSIEGDRDRMPGESIFAQFRKQAEDKLDKNADPKEKKKKKLDLDDVEISGPIPVGRLISGDFNQRFDEFLLNWHRPQPDYDKKDIWEGMLVKVTPEKGSRPKEEDKKKSRRRRRKKKEEPVNKFQLEKEQHVKIDATNFDPANASAEDVPADSSKKH